MSNFAGAQPQAKKFANQNDQSSDVQEVRENIKDLGDSIGRMASRQYERAQDVATDAIQETGDAIQRNPLTAIGIASALVSYSAWPWADVIPAPSPEDAFFEAWRPLAERTSGGCGTILTGTSPPAEAFVTWAAAPGCTGATNSSPGRRAALTAISAAW